MNTKLDVTSNNGYNEAPPTYGGVSSVPKGQQRTEFLPEIPAKSVRSIAYFAQRGQLGEMSGSRYVSLALIVLAIIWATGLLPARWTGVAIILLLLIAKSIAGVILRRRDFVAFHARSAKSVVPQKLEQGELLPVYVTGGLSVEGAERRYTCVPGYYKTFATREHALLCKVRSRKELGLLTWPIDEVGMWYAFFTPGSIASVKRGKLAFGPKPMPTLAIEYEVCTETTRRFRNQTTETCVLETLFVAAQEEEVLDKIEADIRFDMPDAADLRSAENIAS